MKIIIRIMLIILFVVFSFNTFVIAMTINERLKQHQTPPVNHVYYVAVDGTNTYNDPLAGNIDNPWDLQTVLDQPPQVKPGDIILMKQGNYQGHFRSRLTGAKHKPIIIQAMAHQKVIISSPDNQDSLSVTGSWVDYRVRITGTNFRHLSHKEHNRYHSVSMKNSTLKMGSSPTTNTTTKSNTPSNTIKANIVTPVPNAPENVTAYAVSPTVVMVKWSDDSNSSNAATGFLVDRSTDGINFTNIGTTANRYYKDSTVAAMAGYYYDVRAINTNGTSADSGNPFYALDAGYVLSSHQVQTNANSTSDINALEVRVSKGGSYVILGTFDGAVSFGNSKTLPSPTGSEVAPYFIVEYNSSGTAQWVASVDDSVYTVNDIAIDKTGNVAITGFTTNMTNNNDEIFVSKYTAAGALSWTNTFYPNTVSGISDDNAYGNAVTFDNSSTPVVLITGEEDYSDPTYGETANAIVYSVSSASVETKITAFTGQVAGGYTPINERMAIGAGIAVDGTTTLVNGVTGGILVSGVTSEESSNGYIAQNAFVGKYGNGAWTGSGLSPLIMQGSDPNIPTAIGYSVAIDPSTANANGVVVLTDVNNTNDQLPIPTIYKFSSAGATVAGFPAILPDTDIITTFANASFGVDTNGNTWIVHPLSITAVNPDADIRKYSPAGALLWSKYSNDPYSDNNGLNYFPPPGTVAFGALNGSNVMVIGSMDGTSGNPVFLDELTLNPNGNTDIFVGTFSDTGSYADNDVSPAKSSFSINCATTYCNAGINVTLAATDTGGAGIGTSIPGSSMRFSDDDNTWSASVPYATSYNWQFSKGNGSRYLYVQFMDALYNWSPTYTSNAETVNNTLPTGSININGGAVTSNTTGVTLNLSATSTNSTAISSMQFTGCSNLTGSITYAASKSCTVSTGDGTKTVTVKYEDAAGNWSSVYPASIALQTITGSIAINNGASSTSSSSVTLNLTASDLGSSTITKMRFKNENTNVWPSTWQTYSISYAWTLSSNTGTKTVSAEFEDSSGNVSVAYTASISFSSAAALGAACSSGPNCQSGYCDTIDDICSTGAGDSVCGGNADCNTSSGLFCGYQGRCVMKASIPNGGGCDDGAGVCASGWCNSIEGCTNGATGSQCGYGGDCTSGVCNSGTCN